MALVNRLGIDNHFQGVQIIPDSPFIVFSGGDFKRSQGSLFIADTEKKKLIKEIPIGSKLHWHPGGLSLHQKILAVPNEDFKVTKTSHIQFFNFQNPEKPEEIEISIPRTHSKAGAIALHFLKKQSRWLLLVDDTQGLDIYFSHSSKIEDGFEDQFVRWNDSDLQGSNPMGSFGGSSINLLEQCDGKLFLLSFSNTGKTPPILNGKDIMSLYSLNFENNNTAQINFLKNKFLKCKKFCNFDAAAGAHINKEGELEIISLNFFRNYFGKKIRYSTFRN